MTTWIPFTRNICRKEVLNMSKVIGFIPIKFNNQRLPGKNIKNLGGKPLCTYVFETVSQVKNIDEIYVICSDPTIQEYMPKKLHFLQRPKELDADTVQSKQIIEWFLSRVKGDIYALMHVTQPFITPETIETAVSRVKDGSHDSAFAAREVKEFAWYCGKPINYSFENVVRTQELEALYIESELYVFEKDVFTTYGRRIGFSPYIHPIGWKEGICIDDLQDFEMAQAALRLSEE